MAIECQCGVGMIVACVSDGYRVSVRSGSDSYTVVSPNRLVYSQRFPLPPILCSHSCFTRVQLLMQHFEWAQYIFPNLSRVNFPNCTIFKNDLSSRKFLTIKGFSRTSNENHILSNTIQSIC